MKLHMHLDGDDRLIAQLQNISTGILDPKVLEKAAVAGGEVLQNLANPDAPGPHVIVEVTKRTKGMVEVAIGPDKAHWYYRFLEFGAQPHEIAAGEGSVLAFEGASGVIFAKAVHHTGMAAAPFLRPAYDRGRDDIEEALGNELRNAIQREAVR